MDIRENKPFKVSQIESEKPNVSKTNSILTGYIASSFNGGHNKTIAFKQVMAGEKIKEYRLQANFQMLTPLTPSYQNLIMTIRSYFVPNSRVWENAEKFTAQKGGSAEIKIEEVPNLGGKIMPEWTNASGERPKLITNTTIWRDSFISSYLPRIGQINQLNNSNNVLPKVSALPLRGRVAIYNDMERNKEYEEAQLEYKSDTVSQQEWNSYLPAFTGMDYFSMRAKRNNSYYSNYRTEIQGFESEYPPEDMSADRSLITWAQWENKIAEARSEAENAQLNDWDIIAKIRGSKKLTEGKVQKIGEVSFPLNYSAITQNTYNNNENVREDFRVLGKQGAYSYTNIDKALFAGFESVEEGYIHIIATVSADTVFENSYDRLELNVSAFDQYRPDLNKEKFDILYALEKNSSYNQNQGMTAIGFKRKYSEYFKLPNLVSGDMTNQGYYFTDVLYGKYYQYILTNSTYQFFEMDYSSFYDPDTGITHSIKEWKDYSDLMINKNQAIKNKVIQNDGTELIVSGQNQIFFVGKCICDTILPIDEEIKNNYTKWGEH